jgi:hypothetical protein
MHSKNENNKLEIKELVKVKVDLKQEIKVLFNDKSNLELKIMKLRKKVVKLDIKLKGLCNHEWIREPQLYSELYCKLCGVYK